MARSPQHKVVLYYAQWVRIIRLAILFFILSSIGFVETPRTNNNHSNLRISSIMTTISPRNASAGDNRRRRYEKRSWQRSKTFHKQQEEQARKQQEEQERRQQEEQARRQQEEQARRQQEEQARRQQEEQARRQQDQSRDARNTSYSSPATDEPNSFVTSDGNPAASGQKENVDQRAIEQTGQPVNRSTNHTRPPSTVAEWIRRAVNDANRKKALQTERRHQQRKDNRKKWSHSSKLDKKRRRRIQYRKKSDAEAAGKVSKPVHSKSTYKPAENKRTSLLREESRYRKDRSFKKTKNIAKEIEEDIKKALNRSIDELPKDIVSQEEKASPEEITSSPVAAKKVSAKKGFDLNFKGVRYNKGSFRKNEILALNLNSSDLDKVLSSGFEVGSSSKFDNFNMSVARIKIPRGMDTASALKLLQRKKIEVGNFALNRVYRGYSTAKGNQPASVDSRTDAGSVDPRNAPVNSFAWGDNDRKKNPNQNCSEDRCFARKVLGWNDQQLRSCSKDLKIGIIDTSIDFSHPAFTERKIKTGHFISDKPRLSSSQHGTSVFALLSGHQMSQTPGLIPEAEFHTADVFYSDSSGETVTDTLTLLKALEWLDLLDVKIINMSFTGPKDELMERAINKMSERGVVFIAAAGNNGPASKPGYPAAYDSVVAVTAVDKRGHNYRYSSRGQEIDFAAPGVDIWSAMPNKQGGYQSGTSFAVPYVTAAIATVYNGFFKLNGKRNLSKLLDQLPFEDLGPAGKDSIYGRGLIKAPQNCRNERQIQSVSKNPAALFSGVSISQQIDFVLPSQPKSLFSFNFD